MVKHERILISVRLMKCIRLEVKRVPQNISVVQIMIQNVQVKEKI